VNRTAWFALTTGCIAVLGALLLATLFQDPAADRAIWLSAALTLPLQLGTFLVARRYAKQGATHPGGGGIMTGWGIGALLRVGVLAAYGFVGPRLLGLPLAPALISFALFVFLSTVLEPLFLTP
jgi:hypothetical protein